MAEFARHFQRLQKKSAPPPKSSSSLHRSYHKPAIQQEVETWHQHAAPNRRTSQHAPVAGTAQQDLYRQHYGNATTTESAPTPGTIVNTAVANTSTTAATATATATEHAEAIRQKELEDWHKHTQSQVRRSSMYNQTAGTAQNKLYEQYYGDPTQIPSKIPSPPSPPSSSPPPPPPPQPRQHGGKTQLRERYEYRMRQDPSREVFAVTMNHNTEGGTLRTGVISVLPKTGGPKRVEPLKQDPTRAGNRTRAVVATKGDNSLQFRPHERQVSPGFKSGLAGQSSEKLSYNTKCAESRRGYSPEAHHRNLKPRTSGYTGDNFPWHSPDVEVRRNQQLKTVVGPERDHMYDIIAPHKYDEFESMFDPSIKQAATATIDYNKERRSGKQCDRIAHIERVHPLNTSERVFPTHRVFDMHQHHHGKKHVQHQGDHLQQQHLLDADDGSGRRHSMHRGNHSFLNGLHRGRRHDIAHQGDHIRSRQLL